jgi:hypothetical protein
MESIMNRTRRSIRSMVSSVDDDDNDDDGSTPFYAAAIIKAAIPRISPRSTRNTKPRCLHLAPSKVEFEKNIQNICSVLTMKSISKACG